ncbi:MAG: DUF1318 domain-containing protein [Deltaproteobacteria bacterium]|nr:MAG: DUF1318 domain-containing protein [Deltaproteobacteria bacterium]
MRVFPKPIWLLILSISLVAFACVTINIYFPAEKVESVAGEIVKDIRGKKGSEKNRPASPEKDSLLHKTFFALCAPSIAWAEDVTTVSNPTIRALKQRMKSRYAQMKPYYQKGMLREGDDGYVSLGNTSGLGLRDKRTLKGLVSAENNDRKSLYREVAKALKIDPGQINRVAEIFAKEWQKSLR